jgi:uncharacterized protein (DUF1810 family)
MEEIYNLKRFIDAQNNGLEGSKYEIALQELKSGAKTSHWMWYCMPIIIGWGKSDISKKYSISGFEEGILYMNNSVLGKRLLDMLLVINNQLDNIDGKILMGSDVDYAKLIALCTLWKYCYLLYKEDKYKDIGNTSMNILKK